MRKQTNKKALYESIMRKISKVVKSALNEEVTDSKYNIRLAVSKFLIDKKFINYGDTLEWYSDTTFYHTEDGCNGYVFHSEEEAEESVLHGEDNQNARDYVEGAQTDAEWVSYLVHGGVSRDEAEEIIDKQDWQRVVEIIVAADGAEWFLATYSGEHYYIEVDGEEYVLYY